MKSQYMIIIIALLLLTVIFFLSGFGVERKISAYIDPENPKENEIIHVHANIQKAPLDTVRIITDYHYGATGEGGGSLYMKQEGNEYVYQFNELTNKGFPNNTKACFFIALDSFLV